MGAILGNELLGGAAFSPLDIAGLQLWLKTDAIAGLSDGDPVGTWNDSSGNGNNATQATASKKPTYKVNIQNGKPVVRFDGVDDFLAVALSLAQPATVYIVMCQVASINRVPYCGVPSNMFLYNFTGTTGIQYAGAFLTYDIVSTNWNIHGGIYDGISSSARVNGVATNGNAGTGGWTTSSLIGSYEPSGLFLWNGDIAELLAYNSALAAAQRGQVETYLAAKYGITLG